MPTIISVAPQDDHTLVIELENQHKIIYNMKPRLQAVRFHGLSDMEKFKSVKIEDGKILVWDSLCQLGIDEIINLLER